MSGEDRNATECIVLGVWKALAAAFKMNIMTAGNTDMDVETEAV